MFFDLNKHMHSYYKSSIAKTQYSGKKSIRDTN